MNSYRGAGRMTTKTLFGVACAALSAASAGLLFILPVLLLGTILSVVASVARGDEVAWRGSVDLTLVFVGVPALLGLMLLFIPLALFGAASHRLGSQGAIRVVGGLLVSWHAGLAIVWAVEAVSRSTDTTERPETWYAVAFAIAAVVILVAAVVAERRAARGARLLAAGLAISLLALVGALLAVWDSPPRTAANAQMVDVVDRKSDSIPRALGAGEGHRGGCGADQRPRQLGSGSMTTASPSASCSTRTSRPMRSPSA